MSEVITPEFTFTDCGGVRTARLAHPEEISYDQMFNGLVAVYESMTIGELRTNMASAIIHIVGTGRGFRNTNAAIYHPEGTLFDAVLELHETPTLHTVSAPSGDMIFLLPRDDQPPESYAICNNHYGVRHELEKPDTPTKSTAGIEKRITLDVINSLANAIHEREPGFNVDERIFEASPLLFSDLIANN